MLYADKDILINKPALVFSNPMIPYSWEADETTQGGYICIFTEAFLKTKDRNLFLRQSPLFRVEGNHIYFLDEQQQTFVTEVFKNMVTELASAYAHKYDLIINYINLLLHEAIKMQPDDQITMPNNASSRISAMFLELLQRQFPVNSQDQQVELRTATQFADNLCVHVNHLNHAVKEATGKTTSEHITEALVSEAKSLLIHTDWSISSIASCLGFDSASYFNNYFKRNLGITPKLMRNSI